MSDTVIQVDSLWKKYRLGALGTGTLRHDFNRWLHRIGGKPDPYAKVGEVPKAESRKQKAETADGRTDDESQFHLSNSPISALHSDEIWALRDISFEVKQGEILGIIGRNGAGKSTLLKILSRVTAPTSGQVRVKGRIASLLEVGTGFHPELTGRENIFLNGAILGMTKAEIRKKLDEIVAFAEVERFLDTPVKRYSSGMHVRLAFAVAAHLEPEILIVDEVLAVGDAQFQAKCLGKMEGVAREGGRTVLFVTHQLNMAREICTRGLLFEAGRLTFSGGIEPTMARYTGLSARTALAESRHVEFVQVSNGVDPQGSEPVVPFASAMRISVALRNLPTEPVGVNIGIRNGVGKLVTFFSTDPHDGVQLPTRSRIAVGLEFDECSLAPGFYTLDVAVSEPGVRIMEEISSATRFEVTPRRIGGRWPYEARYGDFFPAHRWTVEASSNTGANND